MNIEETGLGVWERKGRVVVNLSFLGLNEKGGEQTWIEYILKPGLEYRFETIFPSIVPRFVRKDLCLGLSDLNNL